MGAWSTAILGNDTSCEVRERFLELYDAGETPSAIAGVVLEEQKENLEYDTTNVWLGLASVCWDCGLLTTVIFKEVQNIVASGEDIRFNEELDAATAFLKKRQKVLEDFVIKISKEKEKPRSKKKLPVRVQSIYSNGMCLSYQNPAGKYIGIYITESEHFKNKGGIRFWIMDFELDAMPQLQHFENAKLFGLKKLGPEWGSRLYIGNITEIEYDKSSKDAFFTNVPKLFTVIGELRPCDDILLANNYRSWTKNLNDPRNIIECLENPRLEWKTKFEVSTLTLNQLLDKVALSE